MRTLTLFSLAAVATLLSSCVSKKKYDALQAEHTKTYKQLMDINARAESYFRKINSLNSENAQLTLENSFLGEENNKKFDYVEGFAVVSRNQRKELQNILSQVPAEKLKNAKTLRDSMNIALTQSMTQNLQNAHEDIEINVEETVVNITISDKLLFQPGQYTINPEANDLLSKIAEIINSENSIDVLVEGHTDSTPIRKSDLKDNWELSVKRATSIVRTLQDKYNVDPSKLIASGRGSYNPVADNGTVEGRALNRRIRIVLIPDLDKFFAMLLQEMEAEQEEATE